MRGILCAVLFVLLVWFQPRPAEARTPDASISRSTLEVALEDDGDILVRALLPSGSAGLIGVGRDRHGPFPVFFRDATFLRDEDGDGTARVRPRFGPAAWSLFVAVDTTSGAVGTLAEGIEARPLRAAVAVEGLERTETVRIEGKRFHVLLIRPGESNAWWGVVADGGGGDADGARDGWTSLSAPRLEPLTRGGHRLERFADGDVLVLLDDREMAWASVEIDLSDTPRGGR